MMELHVKKTSIVKEVKGAGDWTTNDGTQMFKYEYLMEDGAAFTASHKTNPAPFLIGDEVEYIIRREHELYGASGSVSKAGGYIPKKAGSSNNASFALSYAKDLYIAMIQCDKVIGESVFDIADEMLIWLNSK